VIPNTNNLRIHPEALGQIYGFLGVFGFSLTLPATRAAVVDLDPTFVGLGRAIVAAVLAMVVLKITRQPLPAPQYWGSLLIVAAGVILGFPLLSALAMQHQKAAHGGVITGLIPLATAIAATIRVGERPSPKFWLASILGSSTILWFAFTSGAGQINFADMTLLAAVVAAAIGYAEGGRLARILGGWQVICWALVLAAPVLVFPVAIAIQQHGLNASPTAWLGFAYISVISQFLAFFAWYHGMSISGIARVGQIQLLQPFLTIFFSVVLLGEQITLSMVAASCIVIGCVILGRKALIKRQ
jgi:drug/metabolite transporter (DMT)-like permease